MKASAVITQLINRLPQLTNLFTTDYAVTNITSSGTTASVTTTKNHGLSVGSFVNIIGATADVAITSITRSATVCSVETSADHDLTLSANDIVRGKTVTISGATESEFNGTFVLTRVLNRRNFTFTKADAGATTATGTPLVVDGAGVFGYSGLQSVVSVPTPTTFTYTLPKSLYSPAGGTISVRTEYRISGAATVERALEAYTAQDLNSLWGFVVLDDVVASKNRHVRSDATDELGRSSYINQKLVQPFSFYVIAPSVDGITGRVQRDQMEDLLPILCKALIGKKFDSGLAGEQEFVTTFVSHGFQEYNSAYYVHGFNFETVAVLTFEDSIGYDDDVAFRDIDLSMLIDFGTQEDALTTSVDLDEVEL